MHTNTINEMVIYSGLNLGTFCKLISLLKMIKHLIFDSVIKGPSMQHNDGIPFPDYFMINSQASAQLLIYKNYTQFSKNTKLKYDGPKRQKALFFNSKKAPDFKQYGFPVEKAQSISTITPYYKKSVTI